MIEDLKTAINALTEAILKAQRNKSSLEYGERNLSVDIADDELKTCKEKITVLRRIRMELEELC